MSLYDRSVTLGVRLEAAAAADSNDALLAQGQILVEELDQTSSVLETAAAMRATLGVTTSPNLDAKAAAQAIGNFRAGLSRHGASSFQHAPSGTLRDVGRQQRTATERWALGTWRARVDELTPHVTSATSDRLQGDAAPRQRAENRLRKLDKVRDFNPLTDADKLRADLGGDALPGWLDAVMALDQELRDVLAILDANRAQQSPTVRAALARANSPEGLPLDELSDALLAEIRNAGVEEQLVVRHV